MKNFHPLPAYCLVDPKLPEGTPDSAELRHLRSLRASLEQLWDRAAGVIGWISILECALYPVGSHVRDKELTAKKKESHQARIPPALENLAKFEELVIKLNRQINENLSQLRALLAYKEGPDGIHREVCASHDRILRLMGEEEIDREQAASDAADEDAEDDIL